ncbi:MAG: hypothetical protein N0E54_15820 [Candidatus Thiodiazotropha taylori]|nr:hypothetical protein [Candidatus Thiodiazotropha endolucinida]MCW4230207.1 hypothetical protein [Candidatus Thiodiazotropha taylori]
MEIVEKCANLSFMEMNDDLITVVRELAEANEALLQVAGKGDSEQVAELLSRVALLERKRNRLVHRTSSTSRGRSGTVGYESVVPLRDQVIRALHLVSYPATGRLIADVTKTRWEERVETAKLSSLRRDEARSWEAGQDVNRRTAVREVYVVPALSFDRFAPVRGTLALSTWETSNRLIAPLSPRVDMLKGTIALARELEQLGDSVQGKAMLRLVSRLGASIPGTRNFDATAQEVIEAAQAELSEIEEIDQHERAAAAERAKGQLTLREQLFGAPLRSVTKNGTGDLR